AATKTFPLGMYISGAAKRLPGVGSRVAPGSNGIVTSLTRSGSTMTEDLSRYHRQMLLPGFGEEGQRRLLASTALVLGCGALGTVIADMLARAGVGRLVIVDRDFIELTNLQRQVLFDEQDVAEAIPKAEAAKR